MYEHEIRPELCKGRFGIKAYMNPELVLEVDELSTEAALVSLIHQELFPSRLTEEEWSGTAGELSSRLKGSGSSVKSDAEKLFGNPVRLGKLLRAIENHKGDLKGAITSRISRGQRMFTVHRNFRNYDRE
jgi:hypothetical protein